ncbi:MAG: hypothetical protein ACK5NY_08545 [Burkholderiaceae bacterium]
MAAYRSQIGGIAELTADCGKAIIGISSTDPYFVSPTAELYLRPTLEACFERVEFKAPHELEEAFSIGGQLGIYVCANPKRRVSPF